MARAAPAQGRLDGLAVRVEDVASANRLYAKGGVGTPLSGNHLRLSLVEAVYAVQGGRLVVVEDGRSLSAPELLALAAQAGEDVEVATLAYADLRDRGLSVRHHGDGFHVWPRGEGVRGRPWFQDLPWPERRPVPVARLEDLGRCEGVLSCVDEDGEVTHYRCAEEAPSGEMAWPPHHAAVRGILLEDRVLVPADSGRLPPGMGTAYGGDRLLSFSEAAALARDGRLDGMDGLEAHAAARQPHFDRVLPVQEDLARRGVLARSGFKFGTHLRGYQGDPDSHHADWLLHCAAPGDHVAAWELSRAVRVAHGVRKRFCIAVVHPDNVHYVSVSWFRP